jgi:hypothetical protein
MEAKSHGKYVERKTYIPRNHSRRTKELQLKIFHEIHDRMQEMRVFARLQVIT